MSDNEDEDPVTAPQSRTPPSYHIRILSSWIPNNGASVNLFPLGPSVHSPFASCLKDCFVGTANCLPKVILRIVFLAARFLAFRR